MVKKTLAIILSVFLCISLLAACTGGNKGATGEESTETGEQPVSSGVTGEAAKGGDLPTIKYYYVSMTAQPEDLKLVQDEVNKLVAEKIGANVELHPLSFSEVTTKLPLILSSGDDADIVSNSSFAPYLTNYQTKGLLPLDDLLPSVSPDLWGMFDSKIWDAARIEGKIYMAPAYSPGVSYPGFWVDKQFTDKYQFDWENADSWEAWEPLFDNIVANEKGVTPILSSDEYWGRIWFPNYYGYDTVGSVKSPKGQPLLVVKADDPERKITAAPFTDDYKHSVELFRKWYEKGYVLKTPPTEAEMGTLRSTNKFASFAVPFAGVWDTTAMAANEWGGHTILQAKIKGKPPIISTGSVTGSGNSVTKASKHPEQALKFIEQMYTNEELHNLLNFGIKGKHWEWKDESKKLVSYPEGVTAETTGYNPNTFWQFGPNTLNYFVAEGDIGTAARTQEALKDAVYSSIMGFTPNPDPVKNQIAAIATVAAEYGDPLEKGLVDPNDPNKGLEVFKKKLTEAGIDKVIAEFQKQIDDWAANNTK
jgi:putative aldouronate transport system substrate-binding protein